jgi:hypothetical protein
MPEKKYNRRSVVMGGAAAVIMAAAPMPLTTGIGSAAAAENVKNTSPLAAAMQQEIDAVMARHQPEMRQIEQDARALSKEGQDNQPGPIGGSVRVSGEVTWQIWEFVLHLPEFSMRENRIVLHIPEVAMREQRWVYNLPGFYWKETSVLGLGTMHLPQTSMEEQVTILHIPEVAMREQVWVLHLPDVTMREQRIALHVPSFTVRDVGGEMHALEEKGQDLNRRGIELEKAIQSEIDPIRTKYMALYRAEVSQTYDAVLNGMRTTRGALPEQLRAQMDSEIQGVEQQKAAALAGLAMPSI